MKLYEFNRVGEKMYHETLSNGLNIFVFPKNEFQKKYAFFATNYGGMHTRFRLDGNWIDTPAGVAHFLEHKMFDTETGNALQTLAENGASPNAFTSNAMTGYYFDSTENFEKNLETLLSFVSVPWFTQESVDKEQGIIGQEIGMTEDDPDWAVFMNLLAALYENHAIKESIIGTVESISHITEKTLYDCHKAFYDPTNMALCVAGDVDAEEICRIAQDILPKEKGQIAEKYYGEAEGPHAHQNEIIVEMAVSAPMFQIGFKGDAPQTPEETMRQEVLGDLALEALLGSSSALYQSLYEAGLIDQSFSYGYQHYPHCAFLVADGESKHPEKVRDAILDEAKRIAQQGIDPALWQQIVKGCYGHQVQQLNVFETLCIGQAQSFFQGGNYLDFPAHYDAITAQDAQNLIAQWITPARTALSVVMPKGE